MKPNLQKLYDGMPDHALSALAMGAVMRNDEREMLSVGDAIGKKDRNTRSDMARASTRLYAIVLAWQADFWRTATKYMALLVVTVDGDFQKACPRDVLVSQITRHILESSLASRLEAMHLWCDETGLDFKAVAATEVSDFPLGDECKAEPVVVDEILAALRQATRL